MKLVTGGTGFVGGAIVRSLIEEGHPVRVLARNPAKAQELAGLGVEIAQGDILDRSSVSRALAGCDTLYHAAAIYDLWIPDRDVLMRTEIEGTRNVLQAAREAGVEKVVYTSTAATIGEGRGEVGNERTEHRGYFLAAYEEAKYRAEEVVRTFIGDGLPVVIVNPAGVYGPGDLKPSGRSLIDVVNGRIPAIFRGSLSLVYIDDVGRGHLLAAEHGQTGERYILSERFVSFQKFFDMACKLAGTRTPPTGPLWAARLYAEAAEFWSRWTGRPPPLSRDSFRYGSHGLQVEGSRAARELGLQYTPLEEGLPKALAWYWKQGLLKRRPAFLT